MEFLKKRHNKVRWNEILKSVYIVIQQPEIKRQTTFPESLVQLLEIKPVSNQQKKEISIKEEFSDEDLKIGVKVNNAGLILFWPFLTRLFEHLSFIKAGAFINAETMNQAVYILQYLVYNDIDFPEYELVLNKILVGIKPEDHLNPFVTITDEEKDMAQSLLNGLIKNWEKVKNSTPEGIQETFLQREGILKFETDKVSLKVEKKGVDVLIKSIPWNISLIKLAWMQKPLYVEWI